MGRLREWARKFPDKPACILAGTDSVLTYRELDERSNRATQLLLSLGLETGDGIVLMLENDPVFFELCWAARRAGCYYTPISTHLRPDEAAYIVQDCDARIFFVSERFADVVAALPEASRGCTIVCVKGRIEGTLSYEGELARFSSDAELPDRQVGKDFFYSSGTTGKPKGVKQPIFEDRTREDATGAWLQEKFGFGEDTIYLSPAPLYHGAPLRFCMRVLVYGGTNVVMRRFDAENALALIESHGVTHSQWVPTMLFRLLALPDAVKARHSLASHRCAIHSAAPCPPEIKERMIAWWGPIVWEYYSGSERNGVTCISTPEWLAHRGSVGRPVLGRVHILSDDERELPPGETGNVYFDGLPFRYHKDAAKTSASHSAQGWSAIGDLGHVDEDGYLYLTDRKAYTIISGGVNIYPAEVENVLSVHPAVADVAVFGVDNLEFGEEVKAVVQLAEPGRAGPEMADELAIFCRERLSSMKCPRSIDFRASLPRQDNGKLMKQVLRAEYRAGARALTGASVIA